MSDPVPNLLRRVTSGDSDDWRREFTPAPYFPIEERALGAADNCFSVALPGVTIG